MVNAVASVFAAVEDEAEAALETRFTSQLFRAAHHRSHEGIVPGAEVGERRDVALRDYKDMGRGLGADVVKGEERLVLEGFFRSDLPCHDVTEETGHYGRSLHPNPGDS